MPSDACISNSHALRHSYVNKKTRSAALTGKTTPLGDPLIYKRTLALMLSSIQNARDGVLIYKEKHVRQALIRFCLLVRYFV